MEENLSQEEKFQKLVIWLKKRHICFINPKDYPFGKMPDCVRIVVVFSHLAIMTVPKDEEDAAYAATRRMRSGAFFIREEESMAYTIEKMKNSLKGLHIAGVRKKELNKKKEEERKAAKAAKIAARKAAAKAAREAAKAAREAAKAAREAAAKESEEQPKKRKRVHFTRIEKIGSNPYRKEAGKHE